MNHNPLTQLKRMKQRPTFTAFALILTITLSLTIFTLFAAEQTTGTNTQDPQWRDNLLKERAEKDREFKSTSHSPMAGKKRLMIRTGSEPVTVTETPSTENQKETDIELSPQKLKPSSRPLFVLKELKGQWVWETRNPDVTCVSDGKPLNTGSPIPPNSEFRYRDYVMAAYPSRDGIALIVFDPKRPEIQQFSHLLYYPPDPEFKVQAILKKNPKPEKITIPTSQKLEKIFYRYGTLHFKLKGKELQLTAYKSNLQGDDSLFIPFSDATSGNETYGVGRFMDIEEPKNAAENAALILDFNRCYNPLCNYSPAYNCPIPPDENNLTIPINAGEKTYPH